MAFVVGLSVLVAVVLDGTDDAQAATTSTSAPTGPNAEWDPGLILSDGVFRDWSSMTVDDIQTFLDNQGCKGDGCLRSGSYAWPCATVTWCDTGTGRHRIVRADAVDHHHRVPNQPADRTGHDRKGIPGAHPTGTRCASPNTHVDAESTRRRIETLTAGGHSRAEIAGAIEKTPVSLRRTMGRRAVTARTAAAVEALHSAESSSRMSSSPSSRNDGAPPRGRMHSPGRFPHVSNQGSSAPVARRQAGTGDHAGTGRTRPTREGKPGGRCRRNHSRRVPGTANRSRPGRHRRLPGLAPSQSRPGGVTAQDRLTRAGTQLHKRRKPPRWRGTADRQAVGQLALIRSIY